MPSAVTVGFCGFVRDIVQCFFGAIKGHEDKPLALAEVPVGRVKRLERLADSLSVVACALRERPEISVRNHLPGALSLFRDNGDGCAASLTIGVDVVVRIAPRGGLGS